jgi:hypothetical protein
MTRSHNAGVSEGGGVGAREARSSQAALRLHQPSGPAGDATTQYNTLHSSLWIQIVFCLLFYSCFILIYNFTN